MWLFAGFVAVALGAFALGYRVGSGRWFPPIRLG